MKTTTSADGTRIAYDQLGAGPPIILVAGALAPRCTVLNAGRRGRGDAVELYQLQGVGLPEDVVAQLRHAPFRPGLEAIAHTLVSDAELTA
jgi:hypothetical protein